MLGQKTIRRRPLFHGMSPTSDSSSPARSTTRSSLGRLSVMSKRSGGVVSIKSGGGKSTGSEYGIHQDSKWLKGREYVLIIVEAFLSLAEYVVRERYSSILSLIIGCLADSYFKLYSMALATVIIHFGAVCLVFMEETVKRNQKGDPYAEIVWTVSWVVLCIIKSSDFIRVVYGIEGMTNRRKSTVYIFIFTQFVVSSYATYGGVIVNLFSPLFLYTKTRLTIVAFVGTGISLFLFVYVLSPESSEEHKGLGCRVIGCLLLASYYKIFRIKIRGKKGFLAPTETKYDKATVTKTKEILTLYALFLPAIGMAFFTVFRIDIFYEVMFEKIKQDDFTEAFGLIELIRAMSFSSMVVAFFVVWPLLTLIGVKKRETIKFLVGHFFILVSFFYAAALVKDMETPKYSSNSGFVRIFNTRKETVYFEPQDLDFTKRSFSIEPRSGFMAAYPVKEKEALFAMKVFFNRNATNFTMYLSVQQGKTTGYVTIDPPEIIRIRGPYLPLREGPPGTNQGSWPRVFIYNTAETLQGAEIKIRVNTSEDTIKTIGQVTIQGGIMSTIALKPGKYEFFIPQADIKRFLHMEQGAVYGVMIFATSSAREIEVDTVIPANTASWWRLLGMIIFFGMAHGIGNPPLRAMIFTVAPRGLQCMSFAYLACLEGVSLWIMFLGFSTWHTFVTSQDIFAYSFAMTGFFTVNMFVLLKFKDLYS